MGPLALLAGLALALAELEPAVTAAREVEFPFDDAVRLNPGEHDGGKVWRSRGLAYDGRKVPLVVFVHGIIFDGKRHHWLTVDSAGPWDARPFMSDLVDRGAVPPLLVAVPSQTRDATDPGKLFVGLDFDAFVAAVDRAVAPHQVVDRDRVIVIGHSASACDGERGVLTALRARTFTPHAVIAVDGCFAPSGARLLASTARARNVIVTYQEQIWSERPFAEFRRAWDAERERSFPPGLHLLERLEPAGGNGHLALVELTARRWLPVLLPPGGDAAWTALVTSPTWQLPALSSLL